MARTDNLKVFLTDVADAIRTKKGTTELIPANTFDTEIESISGGKEEQSKSVTIIQNGTQTVTPDENKTLSSVEITTNVPQKPEQTKSVTITQNRTQTVTPDEGKVLSSVEITTNVPQKPQQSKSVTITQNGSSIVTPDEGKALSSVNITTNVIEAPTTFPLVEKDINFYGIYGELLDSWSVSEASSKTELPEPPAYEGLEFVGWNRTLENIQTQPFVDVGAVYKTPDNSTKIFIYLQKEATDVALKVGKQKGFSFNIDWGDGSEIEAAAGPNNDKATTSEILPVTNTHSYASEGYYTITLTPTSSSVNDASIMLANSLLGGITTDNDTVIHMSIYKVYCGLCSLHKHAFYDLHNLQCIVLPSIVTPSPYKYARNCFGTPNVGSVYTHNLRVLILPSSLGGTDSYLLSGCYANIICAPSFFLMANYAFYSCENVRRINCRLSSGQNSWTSMTSVFAKTYNLQKVHYSGTVLYSKMFANTQLRYFYCSQNITAIMSDFLQDASYLKYIDMRNNTQVPVINGTSSKVSNTKIIVPDALYDNWIAATWWNSHASQIIKLSDYEAL